VIARHAGSLVCTAAFCLWLLRPSEARAQSVGFPVALDYAAVPGCPNATQFQALVVARLGYDPFSESAPKHVTLRITSQGTALDGRTEWRDASGKWAGDQSFRMASADCLRLTRTMALALAVQLQLLADTRADAEPSPVATPEPATTPPHSAVQSAPKTPGAESASDEPRATSLVGNTKSRQRQPSFALGTGAAVGFGRSSSPLLLGRAFGTLAWQHFSLQLGPELSALASTRRADGAGFTQQLLIVSAAGCLVLAPWNACLVINAGEVRMAGQDIDRPTSARVPIAESGVRVGVEQPIGPRVYLNAHLDGLALLARRTGSLDGIPVWTAPPFAAAIGLDAALRFP